MPISFTSYYSNKKIMLSGWCRAPPQKYILYLPLVQLLLHSFELKTIEVAWPGCCIASKMGLIKSGLSHSWYIKANKSTTKCMCVNFKKQTVSWIITLKRGFSHLVKNLSLYMCSPFSEQSKVRDLEEKCRIQSEQFGLLSHELEKFRLQASKVDLASSSLLNNPSLSVLTNGVGLTTERGLYPKTQHSVLQLYITC